MPTDPLILRILAEAKARPWHVRLREWAWMKWYFVRLDLCGGTYWAYINEKGEEIWPCRRPRLAKILFPGAENIVPIPKPRKP